MVALQTILYNAESNEGVLLFDDDMDDGDCVILSV